MVPIDMVYMENQCFSVPILNPTFFTSGMSKLDTANVFFF